MRERFRPARNALRAAVTVESQPVHRRSTRKPWIRPEQRSRAGPGTALWPLKAMVNERLLPRRRSAATASALLTLSCLNRAPDGDRASNPPCEATSISRAHARPAQGGCSRGHQSEGSVQARQMSNADAVAALLRLGEFVRDHGLEGPGPYKGRSRSFFCSGRIHGLRVERRCNRLAIPNGDGRA